MNFINYYLGIDVGGMSIKCGVADANGNIIYYDKEPINKSAVDSLFTLVDRVVEKCKAQNVHIQSCGMGVPCIFDKKTGVVSYGNNLDFNAINVKEIFFNRYNLNLELANDAMCAALGESLFGASKNYDNSVLITIGTGVGCGIILNNKPIPSNCSAVGELSHTTIQLNGRRCSCGKSGCFEAYASMTALYKDIKREMLRNKKSQLWQKLDINDIDGKVFFKLIKEDELAKKVFDRFIKYLSVGIVNIANLLRPDIIVLGGAVSQQGEILTAPLNKLLNENLFAREYTEKIKVVCAENGNDAGILGACALCFT